MCAYVNFVCNVHVRDRRSIIYYIDLCVSVCLLVLGGTTDQEGTTVEPRYFFITVPVRSRSRYYRGIAIPAIVQKWVPYSQADTNHNASPTNPNRYSKGNHNPTSPTNPTNPTNPNTRYRCE